MASLEEQYGGLLMYLAAGSFILLLIALALKGFGL